MSGQGFLELKHIRERMVFMLPPNFRNFRSFCRPESFSDYERKMCLDFNKNKTQKLSLKHSTSEESFGNIFLNAGGKEINYRFRD